MTRPRDFRRIQNQAMSHETLLTAELDGITATYDEAEYMS